MKGATKGLRLLTAAEDILAADDLVREEVPTPEWGEGSGVLVQSMTAERLFLYYQYLRDASSGEKDARLALVVLSVVDEQGEPVFSKDQIEALSRKNDTPIGRIAVVARRLSRIGEEYQEALSAGLKATNGASPSASPVTSA